MKEVRSQLQALVGEYQRREREAEMLDQYFVAMMYHDMARGVLASITVLERGLVNA